MEITPREKDFFEYGRAYENFRKSYFVYRESKEKLDDRDAWKAIMVNLNRDALKKYIRIAKLKRAACMMWHVKDKNCGNCKHVNIPEWENPCRKCTHCGSSEGIDNWEPIGRKND